MDGKKNPLQLSAPNLRKGDHLHDLDGWDSLKLIELLVATEEKFRVELNEDEVMNCVTVGDLIQLLEK